MTGDLQFEAPTWNQVYDLLLSQSRKIRYSHFNPDIIVGVSRGGWIPARVLSDLLENPSLANVKAESYTTIGQATAEPSLTQHLSVDVSGKSVLVVDEVADSGRSLTLITKHVKSKGATEVKTATLYLKRQCHFKPDFFEKETDHWVVFPWEVKEAIRQIKEYREVDSSGQNLSVSKLTKAGVPEKLLEKLLKEVLEAKTC